VLLIKTAWGGHSLFKQFRPPSVGLPSDEYLEDELVQAQQRVTNNNEKNNRSDPLPTRGDIESMYGSSYRKMMDEVKSTLNHSGELFPSLEGRPLELAGFVWFQGWNDQYGGAQDHYAENLKALVRDLRHDLNAPELPVVIAAMGQNGSKPAAGAMLTIQNAQLSMNDVEAFRGSVKAIRTDELVDTAAETLYPQWRDRIEEWKKTGGDFAYHYLGSAIWFNRIGDAMATAMLELTDKK